MAQPNGTTTTRLEQLYAQYCLNMSHNSVFIPPSPHYHRPISPPCPFWGPTKSQKHPCGTFDEDFADSAQILKLRVVPCPCQTWPRWGSDIPLIKFRPSKVQKIHIWNCCVWLGLDWTWETCNSMKRRVLLFEVSAMHAKTLDSF